MGGWDKLKGIFRGPKDLRREIDAALRREIENCPPELRPQKSALIAARQSLVRLIAEKKGYLSNTNNGDPNIHKRLATYQTVIAERQGEVADIEAAFEVALRSHQIAALPERNREAANRLVAEESRELRAIRSSDSRHPSRAGDVADQIFLLKRSRSEARTPEDAAALEASLAELQAEQKRGLEFAKELDVRIRAVVSRYDALLAQLI